VGALDARDRVGAARRVGIIAAGAVPRRWSEAIDGIRWLPRMIDKARMNDRGELGSYLLGHSPVDFALLTRAGVTTGEFAEIVRRSPDDRAVLATLRARPRFDEPRIRRWSDRFESTYRIFIPMWDLDEGYTRPSRLGAVVLAAVRAVERPAMAVVRRLRRAP
jgi:hypothetical protein